MATDKMATSTTKLTHNQFVWLGAEFKGNNVELPGVKEEFDGKERGLAERMNEFSLLEDEYREVKDTLSKMGESMSDTKMLVDIKKVMKTVDGEINLMDLRMGVLMHMLWGSKMEVGGGDEKEDGGGGVDDDDDDEMIV